MPVRAVSIDELTGGGPIVIFTPTIADACLGCGALLAGCYADHGAFVITTLGATAPAWIAGPASTARAVSRRVRSRPAAIDGRARDERRAGSDRVIDDTDAPAAWLAALGGTSSSVSALPCVADDPPGGRRCPDHRMEHIAELCRARGVRSLFLPLTRHRASRHASIVEVAASLIRGSDDTLRCWRYPVGGDGTMKDRTDWNAHHVRTLDTTQWRHAKREALVRMDTAGFELSPITGSTAVGRDCPDRLAGVPERYLRYPED